MKRDEHSKRTWSAETARWPDTRRQWAEQAAGAMVFAGAAPDTVAPVLAEVRESVAASGQGPTELFGEPVPFGRARGKRHRPPARMLEEALPFHNAVGAVTVLVASLGVLLVVLGIWVGFADGWGAHTFSGPVMLLFVLLFALGGLAVWGWVLRTRGRLRAPLVIWAATLAGFAATVGLMMALGGFEAPGPPNWAMPPIGLVLVVLALKLPEPRTRALVDDSLWDDERYFGHAEKLLRGRYLFSRNQAAAALSESRQHRRHSAVRGTAAEDFGNVERFAAQLAAVARTPLKRGIVLRRAAFSVIVVFFGLSITTTRLQGPVTAWLVVQVLIWLGLVAGLVVSWRPARISAEARRLQAERRRTARLLADNDED